MDSSKMPPPGIIRATLELTPKQVRIVRPLVEALRDMSDSEQDQIAALIQSAIEVIKNEAGPGYPR
jgi:hypothetical protein